MIFSITKKVIIGFALALLLMMIVGVVSYSSTVHLINVSNLRQNSQNVLERLNVLLSTVTDAETGERGYIITGDEAFLEPFDNALKTVDRRIKDVQDLTSDNPNQQRRIAELKPLISRKIALMEDKIRLRRALQFSSAQAAVIAGEGKETMDQIRVLIRDMINEEKRTFNQRSAHAHASARNALFVITAGSVLALVVVALATFFISRDIQERQSAERKIRESEERFRLLLEGIRDYAIYMIDKAGNIMTWSKGAEQVKGYNADEILGRHFSCFYPEEAIQAGVPERQLRLAAELGRFEEEGWRVRKDGSQFWANVVITALNPNNGQPNGYVKITRDMTERKKAEEALRVQAQIIDQIHDSVISTDLDGYLTSWNKGAERLFGYSAEEALGQHISFLYPDDQLEFLQEQVIEPLLENEEHEVEVRVRKKSGEEFYGQLLLSLLREASGPVIGMIGYTIDITDQVLAKRALQARAQQQEAVARLSQNALARLDLSELMNEAVALVARTLDVEFCKILELMPDKEELLLRAGVGWKPGSVGRIKVKAKTNSQAGYTLLSSEPVVVEDLRNETRFNGPPLLIEHGVVSGISVIIPGEAQPFGILGAHTATRRWFSKDDILFLQAVANVLAQTIERSLAEAVLRQQAQIIDQIHDSVVSTDLDGRVTSWNKGAERLFGYVHEEVMGQHVSLVYPEDQREFLEKKIIKPLKEKGGHEIEVRMRKKSGQEFFAHLSLSTLKDGQGGVTGMIGYTLDITDRRQAESALRESESRYRGLVESLTEAIFIEQQGRLVYINSAGLRLLGYESMAELKARSLGELFGREARNPLDKFKELDESGGPTPILEGKLICRNGKQKDVELSFIQTMYEGEPAIQAVGRDITETKNLRQTAQRMEKLAALGQFSMTIAHEVRNPLGVIRLNLDNIQRDRRDSERDRKRFQNIDLSITRIERIISEILDFARPVPPNLQSIDLHHVLGYSMDSIKHELGKAGIGVVKNYSATKPTVQIDLDQIVQVFVNLFTNAKDAMEPGGKLTIHTSSDKDSVRVEVMDTGKGIPSENLERIFNPFFTTKRKGIGLGMAVVSRILEQHQAQIFVESKVGVGTKFTLKFPAEVKMPAQQDSESILE